MDGHTIIKRLQLFDSYRMIFFKLRTLNRHPIISYLHFKNLNNFFYTCSFIIINLVV